MPGPATHPGAVATGGAFWYMWTRSGRALGRSRRAAGSVPMPSEEPRRVQPLPHRHGRRPPAHVRPPAGPLLAALALALLAGGCGYRTPPRPLSEVIPPTADVRAWQRGDDVVVAWAAPDRARQGRYDGVTGYVLVIGIEPLLCPQCPPGEPRTVAVAGDDPALVAQGGTLYYHLPWPADAGRLRIQVRTRYGLGPSPPGKAVVVERAGDIPPPELHWRRVGGGGASAPLQFYWEARRERIVQIIGADGRPRERIVHYRANLYRRTPPQPWPPAPLNGRPLTETAWQVASLGASLPPTVPGEDYVLRYVDQFGNEGPPSEPVRIPRPAGAP